MTPIKKETARKITWLILLTAHPFTPFCEDSNHQIYKVRLEPLFVQVRRLAWAFNTSFCLFTLIIYMLLQLLVGDLIRQITTSFIADIQKCCNTTESKLSSGVIHRNFLLMLEKNKTFQLNVCLKFVYVAKF